MWRCNREYGQGERCCTPTITEEDIKKLFFQAFNKLMSERTSAITDCEGLATELEDTSGLDQEIEATQKEIDTAVEQNRRLIREQADRRREHLVFLPDYCARSVFFSDIGGNKLLFRG